LPVSSPAARKKTVRPSVFWSDGMMTLPLFPPLPQLRPRRHARGLLARVVGDARPRELVVHPQAVHVNGGRLELRQVGHGGRRQALDDLLLGSEDQDGIIHHDDGEVGLVAIRDHLLQVDQRFGALEEDPAVVLLLEQRNDLGLHERLVAGGAADHDLFLRLRAAPRGGGEDGESGDAGRGEKSPSGQGAHVVLLEDSG
jgi:hypothetical protein